MTTHVLQLYDGVNTINLADKNPISIRGAYVPTPSMDGGDVLETFEIYINESSMSNALAKISEINTMLSLAETWTGLDIDRYVYAYLDPADAGIDRMAFVRHGGCKATDLTLAVRSGDGKVAATIEWVRSCFLAKSSTSPTMTGWNVDGKTVTNSVDSSSSAAYGNYLECASSEIGGDYHAPVSLVITNKAANLIDEVWVSAISNKEFAYTGAALDTFLWYEGEDGTASATVSATVESSTTCSMGQYHSLSWTSASETELITWDLTEDAVRALGGIRYGILARIQGGTAETDLYLRVKIRRDTGGGVYTTVATGNLAKVPASKELFLIDCMAIPPTYISSAAVTTPASITLYGMKADGAAFELKLDYLALMPIGSGGGGLVYATTGTAALNTNDFVSISSLYNVLYRVIPGASTVIVPEWTMQYGNGLYFTPGVGNRIYVLWQAAGVSTVDATCELVVGVNPKYRTV
jgi:hypothetical protein